MFLDFSIQLSLFKQLTQGHLNFILSSLLPSLHYANYINSYTRLSYLALMCDELIQSRFICIYTKIVWPISLIFEWMIMFLFYSRCDPIPFKKIHFLLLVQIDFKKHILNFTKFCQHFALVFRLHEMKVIMNHNQICTWISTQNTVDKYSQFLRCVY